MPYPQALHSDTATGILEIVWDDTHRQRLDIALLRRQCPCADCKSLRRQEINVAAPWRPSGIAEIRPVGAYAAQIIFSDGHDRGIFPWIYLRSLKQDP